MPAAIFDIVRMPGDHKDLTVCERVYGVMFNIVIPKISHSAHPARLRYSKVPSTDRQLSSSRVSPKSNQLEPEVTALREVPIQRSFSDTSERDVSRTLSAAKEKERELAGTQKSNSVHVNAKAAAGGFEVGTHEKSKSVNVNAKAAAGGSDHDVNEKADAFIRDFYDQLKKQRTGPDA